MDVVQNNRDDAAVLAANIQKTKEQTGLEVMIGDGAFASNALRVICELQNISLVTTAIRGGRLAENPLTSVDFKRDQQGMIETCPAGHEPISRTMEKDGAVSAVFPKDHCGQCPLARRYMAYRSEKQYGRIKIDVHRAWSDNRLQALSTEEYRDLCRMRPAV